MSGDERDEGFLARWSRRKRASGTATPADPPPEAKPVAAATPAAPPAEAPPEPLPELPPIDSLTSASDFTPFLRQGVAPALRNAALRKLWNDPAIRDAIGPARDYGWDWNVPGGVPGGGPAPSADEIRQFLAWLRGGTEEGESPQPPGAAPAVASPEPTPAPPGKQFDIPAICAGTDRALRDPRRRGVATTAAPSPAWRRHARLNRVN